MKRLLSSAHRPIAIAAHIGLVLAANTLAFWVRFDGAVPPAYAHLWLDTLPWLVAIRVAVYVTFRLYAVPWRYTGVRDLMRIAISVPVGSLLFAAFETWRRAAYPRSIILIDSLVLICLMGGARMSLRVFAALPPRSGGKRVLIYGAGDAGAQIARNMLDDPRHAYRPVGFVDDHPAKAGARIHGVEVLGTGGDIQRVFAKCRPDEVLIAIPGADTAAVRALVRTLEPFKVPIKTLPNLREIVDGRVDVKQIRGLAIEDLLVRAPVGLDP